MFMRHLYEGHKFMHMAEAVSITLAAYYIFESTDRIWM
jgi:hypothetical protein